jgi:toxin ParE1/3/4
LSSYRIGSKAESDLAGIFDYTLDQWGPRHAERYVDELAECFQLLADSQGLGRSAGILAGVRRFEHGSHVIFYKKFRAGIEILRVLHRSMLPTAHFI